LQIGEDDYPLTIGPLYQGDATSFTITLVDNPILGSAAIGPDGNSLVYSPNGAFESLSAGETATEQVAVRIDVEGEVTEQNYEIEVLGANDAPVAQQGLPDQQTHPGQAWSYTFPADMFVDVDGDTITYQALQENGDPLPGWLTFDPATRSFSGTVPPSSPTDPGTLGIDIRASDGTASGDATFTLFTSNVVLAHPAPDYAGSEDTFVSIQLPSDLFQSLDGSALTYTVTRANDAPLDSWLAFDPIAFTISGQPPANFAGGFNIQIAASDGIETVVDKFTLQLQDVPDVPTDIQLSTPWVGEFSAIGSPVAVLSTVDPDVGDHFRYELVGDAGGAFAIKDNMIVVDGYLNSRVGGGVKTIQVASIDSAGNRIEKSFDIAIRSSADVETFASATPTREIWVATSGSDTTGDGSSASPYSSIQFAIDHAAPGSAIMVRAGTYAEALSLNISGQPDAPIWLISADGIGAAEIKPVGQPETNAINGQAIQNWVIEGFAITGTNTIGTYGINIVSGNSGADASFEDGFGSKLAANLVIKDNIITNWGIDGIHLGYVFNTQIVGNTVSGAHEQGIDIVYGAKLLIANNDVSNITSMPAWFGLDQRNYTGDSGITVKAGSIDVQILNNRVEHTNGYGIKIGAPSGLVGVPIEAGLDSDGAHYVSYEAKDVLVEGNTVVDTGNGSIDINAAINVTVSENFISSIRLGGYVRTLSGIIYGGAEQYLPLGVALKSDWITLTDNVYTASTFRNVAPDVHVTESGNIPFDPNAIYNPDDYAWALGQNADLENPLHDVFGTALNNSLSGTAGADYIDGKAGDDVMAGGAGNDIYVFDTRGDTAGELSNEGVDTVILTRGATRYVMPDPAHDPGGFIENVTVGSTGNFSIIGNSLDNVLTGGIGNDQLVGDGGNDTLYGDSGNDMLNGGVGADFLYGGAGDDQLSGGADDDILEGGPGLDILLGSAGNDFLISYDADKRISGGVGVDTLYLDRSTFDASKAIVLDISYFGNGTAAVDDPRELVLVDGTRIQNVERLAISAGAGNDHIVGGYFDDQIAGGAGDDYLSGLAGNDLIWGAAGNDQMLGGDGNDVIDGGQGQDRIDGGAGDDSITSREMDTELVGGSGIDTLTIIRDGALPTFVFDGAAVEANPTQVFTLADGTPVSGFEIFSFTGGEGDDQLSGGSRNDRLQGAHGNDILYGNGGSDNLTGGAGQDEIHGGSGGDMINGGALGDRLWGDVGNDVFIYFAGQAEGDIIYDFTGAGKAGGDTLQFTGYGPGATLTYDAGTQLWTVASADNSLHESFTIVGVTSLIASDYTLL